MAGPAPDPEPRRRRLGSTSAVGLWVRSEWRRRAGSLALLAVIVAVTGGTVFAALAGARRTDTAFARLVAAGTEGDLEVITNDRSRSLPDDIAGRVSEDPDVERSLAQGFLAMAPEPLENFFTVAFVDARNRTGPAPSFADLIVAGRLFGAGAVDEVVINESMAALVGRHVGDELPLWSLTPAQQAAFDAVEAGDATGDVGEPAGPRVTVRIVGLFRSAEDVADNPDPIVAVGPAFWTAHRSDVGECLCVVETWVRPGSRDGVIARLGARFGDIANVSPREDLDARVTEAVDLQTLSLVVAGIVGAVGATVVVAQAIARHVAATREERPARSALGFTARQEVGVALLVAAPAIVAGTAVAVLAAWLTSDVFPLGLAGRAEPSPGRRADGLVLGVGAAGLVVLLAAVTLASAWIGTRRARSPRRGRVRRAHLGGGSVSRTIGLNLAGRRVGAGAGPPVLGAVCALGIAVAGVVGVGVVDRSVDHLLATPRLYGLDADLAQDQPEPGAVDTLVADADVAAVATVLVPAVNANTSPPSLAGPRGESVGEVDPVALVPAKGSISPVLLDGRLPTGPDEVAVGPRLLDDVGGRIGDVLTLRIDEPRTVTVVGTLLWPHHDRTGIGALLTDNGLTRLLGRPGRVDAVIARVTPGARDHLDAVAARHPGLAPPTAPANVGNLRELGDVPTALAASLAVLGGLATAHSLLVLIRSRRRDLVVHRVLGATRRQVTVGVLWAAGVVALLAVVVGVPLGYSVGRRVVSGLAHRVVVIAAVALPWWLAAVVVGAAVVAAAAAGTAARAARRLRPAEVLRVE